MSEAHFQIVYILHRSKYTPLRQSAFRLELAYGFLVSRIPIDVDYTRRHCVAGMKSLAEEAFGRILISSKVCWQGW